MARCVNCDYDNPENEILCVHCGLPISGKLGDDFSTPSVKNGVTRTLDEAAQLSAFPRWGTARLGLERKLLFHVRGYDQPLVVNLTEKLVMGRYDTETGEVPDVNLDDFGAQEMGVSRRHAAILVEDDGLKVMDLGSANSTYINGQKLFAHQTRILRDGDELRLGNLVIRINFA